MAISIQPVLYFASIVNSDNNNLSFAEIDDSIGDFNLVGFFSQTYIKGDVITIVWYDFENECFYRYEKVLGLESECVNVSFMIAVKGTICVWFSIKDQTITDVVFDCEKIELYGIPDEWEKMLTEKRELYKKHRRILSLEVHSYFTIIRSLMKKYAYKFVPMVGGDHEIDLSYIRVSLSDGSKFSMNESLWTKIQYVAKPSKLALTFRMDSSDYYASVWFDGEKMIEIFNRFYNSHPETKSDFIIWMDPENNRYELGLFRQGLREPIIIPEAAYQLIVFKDKFEDYRSPNYNQQSGAWIW